MSALKKPPTLKKNSLVLHSQLSDPKILLDGTYHNGN